MKIINLERKIIFDYSYYRQALAEVVEDSEEWYFLQDLIDNLMELARIRGIIDKLED